MQKLSDYNIFSVEIDKDVFMTTILHSSLDFKQEYILKSNYDKIAHGYLILNNNNIKIINCHLIPRFAAKKDADIFSIIKENCKEKCIIAGDFNEKYKNLLKYLPEFNIPYFGPTYKNKEIDHIIFNFEAEVVASKINTYSVSDHEAIILDISC
jgi:endonuclease/exonuclease/phosphatase family metal-dependent hydrolase